MTIRGTTPDDAEEIAALIESIAKERRYLAATSGFPASSTREFITNLKLAHGVHLVAEVGASIVGWCDVMRNHFIRVSADAMGTSCPQ